MLVVYCYEELMSLIVVFFFQAEDGIRDGRVTGVQTCALPIYNVIVQFARQAGYRKMTLWTQSILHAARHIYKEAGFQVVHEEKHHSFGKDLTAETWQLNL